MRLPKTSDGAIPESTTATPTPVPFALIDARPSVERTVCPVGATVWNEVVGASSEMVSTFGLCRDREAHFVGSRR
jgi:hypothetical protein